MKTNVFKITKLPTFVHVIDVPGVTYESAKSLFKIRTPHACETGKVFFIGDPRSLEQTYRVDKLEFKKLGDNLHRVILNRAVEKIFISLGLKKGRKRTFFPSYPTGNNGLNVEKLENGKLYVHDAIEYEFNTLPGELGLTLLPRLIVTPDGYRHEPEFSRKNFYKIAWKWAYKDYCKALARWTDFLNGRMRTSFQNNEELEIDSSSYQIPSSELIFYNEPQISFHQSGDMTHTWPLWGLKRYHPLDYNLGTSRNIIEVAFIGTGMSRDLLKAMNEGVGTFPGFSKVFKSTLKMGEPRFYKLNPRDLERCRTVEEAKAVYLQALQKLKDAGEKFDILLVELPEEISHLFSGQRVNLRDYLKVAFLEKSVSTQIITPKAVASTDPYKYPDLALGIYVSAGGRPWKLEKQPIDTCFIGVSFGIKKGNKGSEILVGVAELFDEYGESISIRCVSDKFKEEKGYHLSTERFEGLISTLLNDYYKDLKQFPKQVVVHKTSYFDKDELQVLGRLKNIPVKFNFVYISTPKMRLSPSKGEMPKRGDCWIINENTSLLYTDGFVTSARMYLGRGIPTPFLIHKIVGPLSLGDLVEQVMQLTKLNWNSTKNHERSPVTISHARKIVNLLRAGLEPESIVGDFRFYL